MAWLSAIGACDCVGRRRTLVWLCALVVSISGCQGERIQSALHPASPASGAIAWLWWLIFGVTSAVFVFVMILALVAMLRRRGPDPDPPLGGTLFVVAGGIVMPSIILVGFLVASLNTSKTLQQPESDLTIEVVGHQYWWEVRYPDQAIVTANELHIPAGRPVRLELRSADVIHNFWVPQLHGKKDMLPERTNEFWITADQPGVYRGQCAEYCGLQHAWMAFYVVALSPDEFDEWVAERRKPTAEPPADSVLAQGRDVFFQHKCHTCHAIRGTAAEGVIGPDLTHLGSRLSIGAGVLPNTPGDLAGWIVNPQAIKPGNRMPRIYVEPNDLHALRAYLETLK